MHSECRNESRVYEASGWVRRRAQRSVCTGEEEEDEKRWRKEEKKKSDVEDEGFYGGIKTTANQR